MTGTCDFLADEEVPRARLAVLLKHFSRLADERGECQGFCVRGFRERLVFIEPTLESDRRSG